MESPWVLGLGQRIIRYADDFVTALAQESDVRKVFEVLPKRYARWGLSLHTEKRRLGPFGRPTGEPKDERPTDGQRPGSFDLLGFTHPWKVSPKGSWVITRKTSSGLRLRASRIYPDLCTSGSVGGRDGQPPGLPDTDSDGAELQAREPTVV